MDQETSYKASNIYEHEQFWRKKSGKTRIRVQFFWCFLAVKSYFFKNGPSKWVLVFWVAISASRRFIWAIKRHYPMIFNFHFSKGGPFWFRGVWALPQGDGLVKNGFWSVFLGPYGIPHAYKCQAKKILHFSFLATAIPVRCYASPVTCQYIFLLICQGRVSYQRGLPRLV